MRHLKIKGKRSSRWICGVLILFGLLFSADVFAEDTESFKTWKFLYKSYSATYYHGPIQIPADGYLGIRVKYSKPQNDTTFDFQVTVHWPYAENDCYFGSIPRPTSTTSIDASLKSEDKSLLQKSGVLYSPFNNHKKIREYGGVAPDTTLFDDNTPVPAGNLFFEVFVYSTIAANQNIPYELTIFWERAFPEADVEYNRVFDKPVDLGRKLAPFEISSHIGFILPRAYEYGGLWACIRDDNDYFKFKVQKSGYYVITYASTNDWGVDTTYHYCRPVAGLQEETASGSMKYLNSEWWLKETDRIGPYYFSTENTYYLDLQSSYESRLALPYECNASVLFTVGYEGYVKYIDGRIVIGSILLPSPTPLLEVGKSNTIRVSFKNSGTITGNPKLKLIIQNPSGKTVYTSYNQVTAPPGYSIDKTLLWDIPKTYKDEGIHNIKVEILESTELKLVLTTKAIVVKKIPAIAPVLNFLLNPY